MWEWGRGRRSGDPRLPNLSNWVWRPFIETGGGVGAAELKISNRCLKLNSSKAKFSARASKGMPKRKVEYEE